MADPEAVFQRHWDAVQSCDFDLTAADHAPDENGAWDCPVFLNPSTDARLTRDTWAVQNRSLLFASDWSERYFSGYKYA